MKKLLAVCSTLVLVSMLFGFQGLAFAASVSNIRVIWNLTTVTGLAK